MIPAWDPIYKNMSDFIYSIYYFIVCWESY